MTELRRLVNLPGYNDTARDIYETPDLTDDTSTTLTQQTSPRSPSETTDTSDEEEHEENRHSVISRKRLYPSLARDRFGRVDAGGRKVDLSDRVDGRRRGLRVGRKSDEVEGLEERLARLRREIEECKVEAESELDFGGRDDEGAELEGLGRVLASIQGGERRRPAGRVGEGGRGVTPGSWPEMDGGGEVTDEQMLRRVAGFDGRLAGLEQTLGISALDSATLDAVATPVLPSLTLLDQQLAALNAASSLTNLEAAGARIQKLRAEAEQFAQTQTQTQTQSQSRPSTSNSTASKEDDPTAPASFTHEDMTKLHSLYTLLPTLQSLSPTIPALLARLRGLRTLHTNAANAASELDEIETRQAEMEQELKAWRAGLEKVEAVVGEAREANGKNGKVVEGWVRELERRVEKIGR